MYKFKHGLLPNIFADFSISNRDIHCYPTRNANKLRIPLTKSTSAAKFIKKTGVGYWNQLEDSITNNLKIGSFKKYLKNYITQSY